jgi:hypothetical protein
VIDTVGYNGNENGGLNQVGGFTERRQRQPDVAPVPCAELSGAPACDSTPGKIISMLTNLRPMQLEGEHIPTSFLLNSSP